MAKRSHVSQEVREIPLTQIRVSKANVRHEQADKELDDLANSIKKHGLLQPVVLQGRPDDPPPYELIVGQRRYKAHKKLGMRKI